MAEYQALIVDDDIQTANLFCAVMKQVGFVCNTANNAKQALGYLAASKPDVILLDLRLGLEINGEDILYQIRSNPRLDQTKIIIITAYPFIAKPLRDLVEFTLLKPVDLDQLKTLANRIMMHDEQLENAYFRDPVTRLYTREFFMFRLEHVFERFKRCPDVIFGLLAFDIQWICISGEDLFEADRNMLLRKVSDRLRQCYRPTDTISKISGDHFVTLHEDLKQPDDLQVLLSRLKNTLATPFDIENRIYIAQIRIGAILHEEEHKQPQELLDAAIHIMELSTQFDLKPS